jgi:anti-sigma-K factor RskA
MSESNENRCDGVEAYALGGLTSEERQEFDVHLQSCPACAAELRELNRIMELLPESSESVAIPHGMKQRILNEVLAQDQVLKLSNEANTYTVPVDVPIAHATPLAAGQMGRVYRMLMTIGLSAAVIILTLFSAQLRRDVHDLKSYIAIADQPATALKVNEAVALSPAATDIVAKGLATLMIDSTGTHLVVQAEKLPELKGNQAYQVWLLKDKKPVNAGTFLSRDGNGALYYTFEPKDYDTIAITLEPDAFGKKEPRGTLILAAPIKVNIK